MSSNDGGKEHGNDGTPADAVPVVPLPLPVVPGSEAGEASEFAIVGIGASAGGLEAFEQFFRALPQDPGLAFVLVSHLDPSHVSLLTEILQRSTSLPVIEAKDQMAVCPNHVYVIPPNRDMAIFHGSLQLSLPETPRGQRLPIDAFLSSLGEDQGRRAVGIILSGTGSDGTQGLRSILAHGGLALAQEPATAKYDGMPTSAIEAGYTTHVLAVSDMPTVLLKAERQRLMQATLPSLPVPVVSEMVLPASGMSRLLMQLRAATGHDFSNYKQSTIRRRIERRMVQNELTDLAVYIRYLKENPAEMQLLFKELLINVTSFFRDPEAFTALQQEILPQMLSGKPEDYVFRVWIAGCASGEEAYSIAMVLRELMDGPSGMSPQAFSTQIYATDLDDDAIATARSGRYPLNIAADISPARLRRFFTRDESGYRVKNEIREMVVFAVQNVIKDPPFTKLDLLSCRNLMIYLEPELQNRLIPTFHYALKPGGVLMLSPSESVGNHAELFTAANRRWKIYRAEHVLSPNRSLIQGGLSWRAARGEVPVEGGKASRQTNFAELASRMLLKAYAPASVVADSHGTILYVYGETGKYLRPAPGQASLNLVDMAREGLPMELRAAMQAASTRGAATLGRELSVKTNGDFQNVSLSVRPLGDAARQGLLLVSFEELAAEAKKSGSATPARRLRRGSPAEASRIESLESELGYVREKLQITIEEQQSTNEELKSGNEELQSTNEELQSTNEELETSKEELQSLNEELITVNAELQGKVEQLADMQNDLKNLLDNINVGTVFLDQHLLIRRFTRDATQAYRLAASDIGRPLADIKSQLDGDDLMPSAQAVLDTLLPWEGERHSASGALLLVRIQPYRTLDNFIGGVVLTFTDISQRVEAVAARVARELAEAVVDSVREPLLVLDPELRVVTASRSFYQSFAVAPEQTIGRPIYELGSGQWNLPALRKQLETVLPCEQSFENYLVDADFPTIGRCRMVLNARRVVGGGSPLILLAMHEP